MKKVSNKFRGHTPEENESYSNFIESHFKVNMNDKEFKEWLVKYHDKYPMPYPSVKLMLDMYNRKDMEKCWQVATEKATKAEREKIMLILAEYTWLDEDELKVITDRLEGGK